MQQTRSGVHFTGFLAPTRCGRKCAALPASYHSSVKLSVLYRRARCSAVSAVVSDNNVPEGHQGLHTDLYGSGGDKEHEHYSYEFRNEDDGSTMVAVNDWLAARDGEKPVGVYAVYDVARVLQYVGISRNMVLSIKTHVKKLGGERCAWVRAMVFANRAMATRANLERQAQNWIDEAGTLPLGNGVESSDWQIEAFDAAHMSADEAAEYEDKKLKLRKAMGDNLADGGDNESDDAKQRRLKMMQAVEGDNWSAVIDGQTRETYDASVDAAATAAAAAAEAFLSSSASSSSTTQPIASPFARANVHRMVGRDAAADAAAGDGCDMNVAAVDAALDEVRPYLIADGGNVEVVDVRDGIVTLRLQGACGTCAASSATMKMGIERALKATFGELLKEVRQVDAVDTSASVDAVNAHLDMLRPAIENYGGSVDVLSVEGGVCNVRYNGPPPIAMGIKAAIKDKFPDIVDVQLVD